MRTSLPKTVIVSAPQAWGKSVIADQLMQMFGCTSLVDEWSRDEPITPDALHLTNVRPERIDWVDHSPALLVSSGWR